MKLIKDGVVVECIPFHANIFTRDGYVPFDEEPEDNEISYTEMKRIAKENGINSHGMKKEELLEAIKEYI